MDIGTIAAAATSPGIAGIGIVRVSGNKSLEIVSKIFKSKNGQTLSKLVSESFLYFTFNCASCGFSSCIFFIESVCFFVNGNRTSFNNIEATIIDSAYADMMGLSSIESKSYMTFTMNPKGLAIICINLTSKLY